MTHIRFQINYHTVWGQAIYICGSIPELGNFDEARALPLDYADNDSWSGTIEGKFDTSFSYYYLVKENNRIVRREWGEKRILPIKKDTSIRVFDAWKDMPTDSYLYTSVFSESVFARQKKRVSERYFRQSIVLKVQCPYVEKDQTLMLVGEDNTLGNWHVEKGVDLSCIRHGEWRVILNAQRLSPRAAYKFVIADSRTKKALHWEAGENRILQIDKSIQQNGGIQIETALSYRYPDYQWKGVGVAIPLFSIRSKTSFGIGDFSDLKKMVDWAVKTNQQIIQLLPINDTTNTFTQKDSYPYSAISIYALHPIYLGLYDFSLKDKALQKKFRAKAKKLNALPEIDYEQVVTLKFDFMRALFAQDGKATLTSKEYTQFFTHNEEWLVPYAAYSYLRDTHNTACFSEWGTYATYTKGRISRLIKTNKKAKQTIDFYCFLQFLLHQQLSESVAYAHKNGIALKGDIPIGINHDSVDAWTHPHLFNMDTQTGAPPDDFSRMGQNWGFPTYNWHAMALNNYTWWKNRFMKMADYFDTYRIDHILGFFRIWEIPEDAVQGLFGHFSPALPYKKEELIYLDIPFDEARMAKPFIHEEFLHELFGDFTEEVRTHYLDVIDWKRFKLKPFCDTQKKIQAFFHEKNDEKSRRIRDGLYALCSEVLFVRDRENPRLFHPRITAQYTYSYRYLDNAVKAAFNRLYDDFFYHRHNDFWRDKALEKLPRLIAATNMLVCGEDLGMVPGCVPSVMQQLQILSLEIQRMPKAMHCMFSDLNTLPYLSVCTTSTHDMAPLRAWWEENHTAAQHYYNEILLLPGDAPEVCPPQVCELILKNHLQSSAMWVILPWQDWLSIDGNLRRKNPHEERINVPANPDNYWCYRMHLTIEELLENDAFNRHIRRLAVR